MRQVLTILSLLASALTGCTGKHVPFVYKIDIPQGNIVTQEMVDQLERGMDKQRVTFVLGTPLLRDVFHQDRWDYVYSLSRRGGKPERRRISLFFESDRLVRIEGDVKPADKHRMLQEDDPFLRDLMQQLGVEGQDTNTPVRPGE